MDFPITKLANIEDADTVVTNIEAGDGVIKVTTKTKGVPSEENIEAGKVKSVNGKTGDVIIDLSDYLPLSGGTMTGDIIGKEGKKVAMSESWVADYVWLTSSTELGTFTLDLSEYLPTNDVYEVLVKIYVNRGNDTSNTNTNLHVIYGEGSALQVGADGLNFQQSFQCGVLPLNRIDGLKYKLTGYIPESIAIEVFGYKKVN